MKKILAGLFVVSLLVGCGLKKTDEHVLEPEKIMEEPVAFVADSFSMDESSIDPEPEKREESFDDFVFFFLSNEEQQHQRIHFPLKGKNAQGKVQSINENEWKHAYLFAKLPYYTLLFDRESDMERMDNIPEGKVALDCYELSDRVVRTFVFTQEEGKWWLEELNVRNLKKTNGEDFFRFYQRFATDTVFQSQRIHNPLYYITADPDDDFAVLETTIYPDQWDAFRPMLPNEELWNIQYGQRCNDTSLRKIVALKGIGNGFSNLLYFQVGRKGKWELYKFEDISI